MNLINRSALVIRYREPYVAWATGLDAQSVADAEHLRTAVSVYLIPQDPTGEDESAPVEEYFDAIFSEELGGWCTDESRWPQRRDYATFQTWFDIQVTSVVTDLGSDPLATEDL